jgi:hypothetical protein
MSYRFHRACVFCRKRVIRYTDNMGKKNISLGADDRDTAKRLLHDIPKDVFVRYDIDDFGSRYPFENYPQSLIKKKLTSMTVLASGIGPTGILVLVPDRLDFDESENSFYFDKDPSIFAFSKEEEQEIYTGIFALHQDFEGRTTQVDWISGVDYGEAILQLRSQLCTGQFPTSECPDAVQNALNHMISKLPDDLIPPACG